MTPIRNPVDDALGGDGLMLTGRMGTVINIDSLFFEDKCQ
jgi:hypothetical protein